MIAVACKSYSDKAPTPWNVLLSAKNPMVPEALPQNRIPCRDYAEDLDAGFVEHMIALEKQGPSACHGL